MKAANNSFQKLDHLYLLNPDNLNALIINTNAWRHVEVTDQRTSIDYAQQMKYLVDERYPDAEKIRVVQDNLNTHVKASLYPTFRTSNTLQNVV
jgi:hypothetical protein